MATTLEYLIEGTHTGANNAATLTDSTASFLTRRVHTGDTIYNLTDGSSTTITGVTATTISGVLAGGAENDWDTGDLYRIWVSELNKIRHTYSDTRGYPASAEITVCSPLDVAKDTYRDYQKIRLTDSESSLIYFYGKIESGDSAFDPSYGQVINLFARDNNVELLKKVINTNYSDATTLRRGRAVAGGGESIGLINKLITNHAYSVANINTTGAGFESSAVAEAANVLDQNYVGTGKTVLKGIQELANEDPWDSTPTGFGYDFYLDSTFTGSGATPQEQYFKRGTRPSNSNASQVWQVDADAGPIFVDETADFSSAAANDVSPFPAAEAVGDTFEIGFTRIYAKLQINVGTAGNGAPTVVWEYWNGTIFTALSGVTDGTSAFSISGTNDVTFTAPSNWATTSRNGSAQLYYVRARLTAIYGATDPLITQGWISGALANGLTVELNAVDANQKRSMFMDYYFPTATKE
ncbi:MAG: hypothetical protein Q8Q42_03345, partial [Nanoarchaeota archaeon]|nr:hypothetical protein [Nanoarchaeota archaeon]